jgi:MFS transporter, YNFM family, putative membrane transport protein
MNMHVFSGRKLVCNREGKDMGTDGNNVEGRLQGGLIAAWLGWHWIFISFAITTGLGTLLMALLLPGIKPGRQVSGRTELKRRQVGWIYLQLRTFFHQRRIIGASLMALAFFFTFISIFTYIPYRMKEAPFSLSDSAVSLLYLVYLVGLFVPLWVGRLSDKVGRRIVLGCTLSGVTVGILLTALPNLIGIVMGLAVLCSSLFATQTVATAFVGDNANTARGSAASFYMLWYYIGGFLGPLLCGLAWQGLGWWGVLALCLIAISVSFASLLTLCA